MDERLVSTEADNHESAIEQSLRPQALSQYIGQQKVKDNLSVFIEICPDEAGNTRSCPFIRTARTRENNACVDYCQ